MTDENDRTELLGLAYSPWTQRAVWVLEHHGVDYRFKEHLPMLGEPSLRLRTGKLTGRATVPVLFQGGRAISDSFAIFEHVESKGSGAPLTPKRGLSALYAWNERSERALDSGRGLVTLRTARSPRAKEEALPSFFPDALRPALRPVASLGIAFFDWKYGLSARGEESHRDAVRTELRVVREALGGRRYLVDDTFSYADIVMSGVLQVVAPFEGELRIGDGTTRLGEATREVWRDDVLAQEFPDLVAWRDALYAEHRKTS